VVKTRLGAHEQRFSGHGPWHNPELLHPNNTRIMPPEKRKKALLDIDFVLKRVFKKTSFRSVQREVIEVCVYPRDDDERTTLMNHQAALEGFDVYLQASTGTKKSPKGQQKNGRLADDGKGLGKSLTFQLPAVVTDHGTTIVVSPLLSIMVSHLRLFLYHVHQPKTLAGKPGRGAPGRRCQGRETGQHHHGAGKECNLQRPGVRTPDVASALWSASSPHIKERS
jgi:hypothetical protein